MSDAAIGYIIIGVLVIALSKPVTMLHMKLVKVRNRIFVGKNHQQLMKRFYRWYPKFFFYTWLGLGILITVYHLFRYL